MTSLVEKLHNDPEIDVVLIDSPGSLKAEGLVPIFVNSDIIVVPFHYDLVTIPSTASFLLFLDRLRQAVGERMKAQLFIIPNLNDNRVGKRSELILWDTIAALDMQYRYVSSVFDKIYFSIFDKTGPIREMELSGIQLTENLYPKSGKKKYQAETSTHIALDEAEDEEQENNSEHQHNQ